MLGISLVVQWLRLHAPNAGYLGSIPCQGTRSYMMCGMVKKKKEFNYLKLNI